MHPSRTSRLGAKPPSRSNKREAMHVLPSRSKGVWSTCPNFRGIAGAGLVLLRFSFDRNITICQRAKGTAVDFNDSFDLRPIIVSQHLQPFIQPLHWSGDCPFYFCMHKRSPQSGPSFPTALPMKLSSSQSSALEYLLVALR